MTCGHPSVRGVCGILRRHTALVSAVCCPDLTFASKRPRRDYNLKASDLRVICGRAVSARRDVAARREPSSVPCYDLRQAFSDLGDESYCWCFCGLRSV